MRMLTRVEDDDVEEDSCVKVDGGCHRERFDISRLFGLEFNLPTLLFPRCPIFCTSQFTRLYYFVGPGFEPQTKQGDIFMGPGFDSQAWLPVSGW